MKTRVFWTGLAALAVAMGGGVLWYYNSHSQPASESVVPPQSSTLSDDIDINKVYRTTTFVSVEEAGDALLLSGVGEPEAVLSIQDSGVRVRNLLISETGNWSTSIPIKSDEIMEITLAVFIDEETKIVSDETVYRVPLPLGLGVQRQRQDVKTPPALILTTTPGGASRILQTPFTTLPTDGSLSLGPVDYDDLGGVIFSGTSTVPGRVRIYVNDQAIGDTGVTEDGRWFYIRADTLAVGRHTIMAEMLTSDTTYRVSVPFVRLSPNLAQSDEDSYVRFEPRVWQFRYALPGGGGQYTAIFAPEDGSSLPVPQAGGAN